MVTGISIAAGKLSARIRLLASDPKNFLPLGIIVFLLAMLALRSLIDELGYEIGFKSWSMFADPKDRFADLLKAALTYKFITQPLIGTSGFAQWPDAFKSFLVSNPNTGPLLYNLHLLPSASLLLMSAAKLIVLIGITPTYFAFLFAYIACVLLVARFFRDAMGVSSLDAAAVAFALLVSYPVLFMLTRGNFNAGFTTLFLCFYAISALSGKARWAGWLAFALAITFRPNVAILAGIEFAAPENIKFAILRMMIPAVLSVALFALGFTAVHYLYPIYTIPNLLHGLQVYNTTYFLNDGGDDFNLSVYAADKFIRHIWHIGPYFSHTAFYVITLCGAAMIATTFWLLIQGKLARAELVFFAFAFCVMFTPVFTLYHMGEFAAVLLLLLQEHRRKGSFSTRNMWLILTASLLVMSPLGGPRTNGLVCSVFLLSSCVTILRRGMHRSAGMPWAVRS